MGNKNRPVIGPADLDLFIRIAKHGFVDMDYIYQFAYPGRKKRTKDERILQLEKHNYLLIDRTFIPPDYTIYYRVGYRIIALGQKALDVLSDHDYPAADHAASIKLSSPYRMYHQAQISMICDTLQQQYNASADSKWEVIRILNEKEAYLEEALNQPDAAILFKQKEIANTAGLIIYLEIERSYASVASLTRKLKGYAISIKKKLYEDKVDLKLIEQRVLFVAQTRLQRDALINKLNNLDIYGLHLYISSFQEVANDPLNQVFMVTGCFDAMKLLSKFPEKDNSRKESMLKYK